MSNEVMVLCMAAAAIGFFHTVFGPDHYLPFIVMSRARSWPLGKTALITFFCGLGHILSSVILGFIGIALGVAVMKLEAVEGFRGNLAAWALIGFGLAYFVWGIRKAIRGKPHTHSHEHADGDGHDHEHTHLRHHAHVHAAPGRNITPWVLFTIFVLGPCEPLIPILMYPAAKQSIAGLILVTAVFGSVTILTMLGVVIALSLGLDIVPLGKFERYAHAMAGAMIFASGAAIQFLGL